MYMTYNYSTNSGTPSFRIEADSGEADIFTLFNDTHAHLCIHLPGGDPNAVRVGLNREQVESLKIQLEGLLRCQWN